MRSSATAASRESHVRNQEFHANAASTDNDNYNGYPSTHSSRNRRSSIPMPASSSSRRYESQDDLDHYESTPFGSTTNLNGYSRGMGVKMNDVEGYGDHYKGGYDYDDNHGYAGGSGAEYEKLPLPLDGHRSFAYPPKLDTSRPLSASPLTSTPAATSLAALSKFDWRRLFYDNSPNEIKLARYLNNIGVQKRPYACWTLSVVMACVLIWELVQMKNQTGSLIATTPTFNPMIGPSGASLISSGARFVGCMKFIPGISDLSWTCLNASNSAVISAADVSCTMSDVCQFGGFPPSTPNQSFRFFLPVFLHAGLIHLLVNLLAQCIVSAAVERQMGTVRFLLLYFPCGFFGFVCGANFALPGQPSVGASGAIFGTQAALIVDLVSHWGILRDEAQRPGRKLAFLMGEIVFGLALGRVPGIDNFSHIGGFLMGILCSILLLPVIHQTRRHSIIFLALRCIAFPLAVILFVLLARNFYANPGVVCTWCRYLSCWPSAANNRCQGTGLGTTTTTTGSSLFSTVFMSIASLLI